MSNKLAVDSKLERQLGAYISILNNCGGLLSRVLAVMIRRRHSAVVDKHVVRVNAGSKRSSLHSSRRPRTPPPFPENGHLNGVLCSCRNIFRIPGGRYNIVHQRFLDGPNTKRGSCAIRHKQWQKNDARLARSIALLQAQPVALQQ